MADWDALARAAATAASRWDTPVYLFHWDEIDQAVRRLDGVQSPLPVRQWLSCKTLALQPVLRRWREAGRGVEVVSPFELRAALAEGFDPASILVNGTAKHRWMTETTIAGVRVQFDSLAEVRALAAIAAERGWRAGIRVHTTENRDPDDMRFADHFGLLPAEMADAMTALQANGVAVECVGFHLRSNLRSIEPHLNALREVARACKAIGLRPIALDLGGGLPAAGERVAGVDGGEFEVAAMREVFAEAHRLFPTARELWLENGRFVTSRAGALVIRVRDVKEREGMRYLICDGGRVNHAFPSDWQQHAITAVPERSGAAIETTICGPTCMAYDILGRVPLAADVAIGDLLVWHDAGAYHLAWETRFSFGLTPIVWSEDDGSMRLVREREEFRSWWAGASR